MVNTAKAVPTLPVLAGEVQKAGEQAGERLPARSLLVYSSEHAKCKATSHKAADLLRGCRAWVGTWSELLRSSIG
jgi:hypothetical protein